MRLQGKLVAALTGVVTIMLLIFFLLVYCCGCVTTKKTTKVETAIVTDSVRRDSTALEKATAIDMARIVREEQTTTEGVAATDILMTYDEARDMPDTVIRKNNTTLTAYTDKKGRVHIDCATDSLVRVVTRMRLDSSCNSQRYDSLLQTKSEADKNNRETTLRQVVEQEQSGWMTGLRSVLIMLLPAFVFGFFVGFIAKSHLDKMGI